MADPIPAASIILTRGNDSKEYYLVRRADNLRFFGGFTAFAGGKINRDDIATAGSNNGLTASTIAAIRELFEETGILLARSTEQFPDPRILANYRRALLDNQFSFSQLLSDLHLTVVAEDLQWIGQIVTPPFSALRFETDFFLAQLPRGQNPDVWEGELSEGWWSTATDALRDWNHGKILLSPPTVTILRTIDSAGRQYPDSNRLQTAFGEAKLENIPTIWILPEVLLIPLATQGLPPATHTNAYLIGNSCRYLIDPGPVDSEEQDKLIHFLKKAITNDKPLEGVLLTHHHPDHIGAADRIAREFQVPILAHDITADRLKGQVHIHRRLADGEELDLGLAPGQLIPWKLKTVFTPGHAPGHLVFVDNIYHALFAGDMISGLSTVVIIFPDGNLIQYVQSLRLLKQLNSRILLPAHGSPTARTGKVLEEAIRNRELREKQLVESLSRFPRSLEDITLELYRGLPASLMHLAEKQTHTGLLKLQSEGRAIITCNNAWKLSG